MAEPRFVVHTTTVIHKEYIIQAPGQSAISTEWLLDKDIVQEGVVCEEITHIKCINDYEYHHEYSGNDPMNDPVEGSRYEVPRGEEDE